MKNIFLILIFVFTVVACTSDTVVKSQVVDQNGRPIEKVMVQVMSSDIFVMTDEDGQFTIDTKERGDELIFKKEGYQLLIKNLADLNQKVKLIPK